MHRLAPTLVLGALVLTAALAGCKSSATPASSTGGTTKSTTTTNAGSAAGGTTADGLGHPVNVCSLLPVATVATLSGENLTVANENDTVGFKLYACNYANDTGTEAVMVSVLAMDAVPGYNANVAARGSSAKPVAGLGDKAYSTGNGVEALFGNVSIDVTNLQSTDAAVQIIKTLQPKL